MIIYEICKLGMKKSNNKWKSQQQCNHNLFCDNLKKLILPKQFGVFAPSEVGNKMLVLFKKEK